MGEPKIDLHTGVKYDYELTSNGSSASLSLNDSYSYESDFASGSSMRSSFGEYCEDFCQMTCNKLTSLSKGEMLLAPTFPRISLVNETWEYRGEGGANLVISIKDMRKIIRFKKTKYMDKDHDGKIREIAHYANEVMRPALGHSFVRPISIGVLLSEADTEHVRREAQKFRPPERWIKDIAGTSVILSPDCVFLTEEYSRNTTGDTFSIEIKPKQGWHSVENASCVEDLCHRCLKQYAKLYKGEITSISRYCPLDLFSGDQMRMKKAIFDLFERPHNRFKVFKNGQLLYTESVGNHNSLKEEIQNWLGPESYKSSDSKDDGNNIHRLSSLLCTALLAPIENDNSCQDESLQLDKEPSVSSKRREAVSNQENQTMKNVFVARKSFALAPSVVEESKSSNSRIDAPIEDSKVTFQKPLPCNTRSQPLPKNCILQRLLTLQKHTDISNQEAKHLCDRLLNNVDNLEKLQELVLWHSMDCARNIDVEHDSINAYTISPEERTLDANDLKPMVSKSSQKEVTCCQPLKDKILHSSGAQIRLSPPPTILKRDLSLSDIDAVHQLQRFLLSVTAKDVSLLLTFRSIASTENNESGADNLPIIEMEETGKRYRVMISVVDLDPKPVHRIRHWVKRKEEWLKIYSDSVKVTANDNLNSRTKK